jgi:hypothetical protein
MFMARDTQWHVVIGPRSTLPLRYDNNEICFQDIILVYAIFNQENVDVC